MNTDQQQILDMSRVPDSFVNFNGTTTKRITPAQAHRWLELHTTDDIKYWQPDPRDFKACNGCRFINAFPFGALSTKEWAPDVIEYALTDEYLD